MPVEGLVTFSYQQIHRSVEHASVTHQLTSVKLMEKFFPWTNVLLAASTIFKKNINFNYIGLTDEFSHAKAGKVTPQTCNCK